jgi:hypothetical protein
MAVNEGKAVVRKSQSARKAFSTHGTPGQAQHSAISKTGNPKNKSKAKASRPFSLQRRRRGSRFFRFQGAKGKIVEFIEMGVSADFPCIEIAFADKTALVFSMDTHLTIAPVYSDWTTGNQRVLREWPVFVQEARN